MDSDVAAALDEAFPDRSVAEVGSTGPSWNETNRTVHVSFADGDAVYLKVAADGDGSRVARERAVAAYVTANTAVRAPRVVACDPDAAVPYLATAPLDGRPLVAAWGDATLVERAALARQVGTALARLHDRRLDAHGHVTGGGADGLELDAAPWTDVLVDRVEYVRELGPSDRFDHHFDAVREAVLASRDLLDDAPAALVHGDPAQPNCVHAADDRDAGEGDADAPGTAVGFVDWEIAHVGDPARELVRARAQQFDGLRERGPERVVAAFHDGYRDVAGALPDGFETRRPVYEAVRLLGTCGFFERTAEYVDEPRSSLAAWVDAEMERRLAAIP